MLTPLNFFKQIFYLGGDLLLGSLHYIWFMIIYIYCIYICSLFFVSLSLSRSSMTTNANHDRVQNTSSICRAFQGEVRNNNLQQNINSLTPFCQFKEFLQRKGDRKSRRPGEPSHLFLQKNIMIIFVTLCNSELFWAFATSWCFQVRPSQKQLLFDPLDFSHQILQTNNEHVEACLQKS